MHSATAHPASSTRRGSPPPRRDAVWPRLARHRRATIERKFRLSAPTGDPVACASGLFLEEHTYLPDALGSTLKLTDTAQASVASYSYEPYGKTTVSGSPGGNSLAYTGRENDGTGLYYYRARYYHPGVGRFIAEDPIGIDGGDNLYTYVEGNPLSFVDPTGEITYVGIAVAGVAAYGAYSIWNKSSTLEQCKKSCKLQCINIAACGDPDRTSAYQDDEPRCINNCIPLCIAAFGGGPKKGPTGPQPPKKTPNYFK